MTRLFKDGGTLAVAVEWCDTENPSRHAGKTVQCFLDGAHIQTSEANSLPEGMDIELYVRAYRRLLKKVSEQHKQGKEKDDDTVKSKHA